MDGMTVGELRAFLADMPEDALVLVNRKGYNIITSSNPIADMVYMLTKTTDRENETIVLVYDLK